MINFSNELGKRQPASKMTRVDRAENSLGGDKEGGTREKRAGEHWHRGKEAVTQSQVLVSRTRADSGRLSAEFADHVHPRSADRAGRQGGAGRNVRRWPHVFSALGCCLHLPGAPGPALSKQYKIGSCACISSLRTEITLVRERGMELC